MKYVIDDNDYLWYYDNDTGHIRCVGSDYDPPAEDGYFCWNLADGVELLIQYGYITGKHDKIRYLDT